MSFEPIHALVRTASTPHRTALRYRSLATLTQAYIVSQALLAIATACLALLQRDVLLLSRAALHLGSVCSLFPVARKCIESQTLPAFAAITVISVDALLLAAAAFHQLTHFEARVELSSSYLLIALMEALCAVIVLFLVSGRAFRTLLFRRAFKMWSDADRSPTPGRPDSVSAYAELCSPVIFLQAASCFAVRAVDIAEGLSPAPYFFLPLLHAFASICILATTYPLARTLARILLFATPDELIGRLNSKLDSVKALDGVISVHNVHFWEEHLGKSVGVISVLTSVGTKPAAVSKAISDLFQDTLQQLTVQVEEDSPGEGLLHMAHGDSVAVSTNITPTDQGHMTVESRRNHIA